ncbi:MAG: acyl--CoA ligase [Oscillospiraceae bacterium]|nr:acyl--CoA ligase [Oscillospiraceae bacterium]
MDMLENITIPQLLHRTVRQFPDREAIWDRGRTVSYAELESKVAGYGAALCAAGVNKGDHVAIWAENSPQTLYAFYAVMSMGAVAVMMNTSMMFAEMESMLRFSRCRCLIVGGLYKASVEKKELDHIREAFPELLQIFTLPGAEAEGYVSLDAAGEEQDAEMLDVFRRHERSVVPQDTATMLFTSGTSGKYKGVLTSHFSQVNCGLQQARDLRADCKDRFCCVLPMFHCFSISTNLFCCLAAGGCLCFPENRRTGAIVRTIKEGRCTVFNCVPTLFYSLMARPDFRSEDFATLRTGIIGGAPYSPKQFADIEKAFSMTLMCSLGQTEATSALSTCEMDDPLSVRSTTLGHFISNIEGRIADPVTGEALPDGHTGEICIRGFSVMQGYYRMPAVTARVIDSQGWLHTGDLGMLDKRGYLVLKGRLKELIIRAGEKISPAEVETAILSLPQVMDCKVLGIPSSHYGEEVCACVVLKPGEKMSGARLRSALRPLLAEYKIPSYICLLRELPLNGIGKVDMPVLLSRIKESIPACSNP